jgi:hypothetical protein
MQRPEKRGWNSLILKTRSPGVPPPPVFLEKRLQAIENKGRWSKKEGQEIRRGSKLLKNRGLDDG